MGRLTKYRGDRADIEKIKSFEVCAEVCKYYDCYDCPIQEAITKLAHYEDLEEQLMESAEIDIDSMVGEFMHYYNLQKENRLIELPCAVGDTVWEILTIPVVPDYLKEKYIIWEMTFELSSLEDIGEWVFLTKEEAERKLEELKGETV